jgi:outer membrane protein assembly factor BamB
MESKTRKSLWHLLALSALIAFAPPVEAGSWSSFRGPLGAGATLEELPPGAGPLALELAWKKPLGSGYSGISVAGNSLVTGFAAGDRDVVAAFDRATGEERWRYDLAPRYVGHDGSHDGPVSTPAIADGRVFALDPMGRLVALDLANGEELWTTHLVDDHGSEVPYYGFGSSPVVAGDVLVLQIGGEEGSVAGFDVASGELRWRSVEDETMAQSPILTEIAGRTQVLVLGSKLLVGLDPADGSVLWQMEHGGEPGPMGSWTSSPLPLGDGTIFVKHEDPTSSVVAVTDEASGPAPALLRTSRGLTRSYSPPAVSGERVYGFTARFLSAVDPATGEILWRSRVPGDGFVIAVDDQLAVLTKIGGLHLGAASPEGWSETAGIELFEDLAWTPPSYADGAFYLRSLGEIARVDLVRTEPRRTAGIEVPAILARVAEADDPGAAADELLAGRDLPLFDGERAIFVWRGEADDVAVAGDMIGMRREEKMHRLAGTDLWWWATELDPRARVSYLFFVDYEPAIDPSHDRRVKSTVLAADMNWFRGGEPMEMSWFAGPKWPGRAAVAGNGAAVAAGGRMESFEIAVELPAPEEGGEAPEPVQVPVHVWLPPGYDESEASYPVVYAHNPFAREPGGWPATLDRVVGKSVEPLIAVFPEVPRMRGMRGVFVSEVVPAIDERYRTRVDRESRANVGQGWPGFAATALTFSNSDQFGVLAVQSFYALTEQMGAAKGAVGEATAETVPMRIYLEWGRWDLNSPHEGFDMRESSREAWRFFSQRGWEPMGGEVWDSTDWGSWNNRTAVMLEQLFPLEEAESRLGDWLTGSAP